MRILVFGDSITQGFWDVAGGGWVQRIRRSFDERQVADSSVEHPAIFNLGVSADLTSNVLARFDQETAVRKHGHELIFVFAIGVNDAQLEEGNPLSSPERYEEELAELIGLAKGYSEKILLVGLTPVIEKLTMPVSWGDYVYTNERILLFENVLQKVGQDSGLPFVPVFDHFMKDKHIEELLPDGLHPGDAGHELIARHVKPELQKLIG